MKRLVGSILLGSMLAVATTAMAAPIAPTDFDVHGTPGILLAGPTTDDFTTSTGNDIGDLENEVWFDAATGRYTYVHTVTPGINFISEFNTGFNVRGFTGVAGFSFSDSGAAGGTGAAADFSIELDPDGTIDWENELVNGLANGWGIGESITFFFVSSKPPTLGSYNLIDGQTGTGTSFAPTPEPGSIALVGSGLIGLYGAARRRFRKQA